MRSGLGLAREVIGLQFTSKNGWPGGEVCEKGRGVFVCVCGPPLPAFQQNQLRPKTDPSRWLQRQGTTLTVVHRLDLGVKPLPWRCCFCLRFWFSFHLSPDEEKLLFLGKTMPWDSKTNQGLLLNHCCYFIFLTNI